MVIGRSHRPVTSPGGLHLRLASRSRSGRGLQLPGTSRFRHRSRGSPDRLETLKPIRRSGPLRAVCRAAAPAPRRPRNRARGHALRRWCPRLLDQRRGCRPAEDRPPDDHTGGVGDRCFRDDALGNRRAPVFPLDRGRESPSPNWDVTVISLITRLGHRNLGHRGGRPDPHDYEGASPASVKPPRELSRYFGPAHDA